MRNIAIFLLLICLNSFSYSQNIKGIENFSNQTPDQILKGINGKHPAGFLILASHLLKEEKFDDAVMWFYTGQIRYRAYLKANPNLDPSGDPALFSSLMDVVGRPINEYAGGDIDLWLSSIDKALTWHKENDDNFMGKSQYEEIYEGITSGLIEMREQISANRKQIMEQRTANGLENR